MTTSSEDSEKEQTNSTPEQAESQSPFDPAAESLTAANRLNRALGLPESASPATIKSANSPSSSATSSTSTPVFDPARAPQDPPTGSPPASPLSVPPGITLKSAKSESDPVTPDGKATAAISGPEEVPEKASFLKRRRENLRRVRRARRTIRHVDPWSVFKISVLLYICLYVAVMVAGVLLWSALQRTGLVEKLEDFIAEVGSYSVWEVNGNVIYERARIIGLVLAAAGVAMNVLLAIVFNLISDLVGGVRLTILEEDKHSPDRK